MGHGHHTSFPVGILVVLLVMGVPALANSSASFKESASRGASVVLAKCSPTDRGGATCKADSAIRGTSPSTLIYIPDYVWQRFRTIQRNHSSEATRFLLVLDDEGTFYCGFSDLIVLGDLNSCIIPIINNQLPDDFRYLYDGQVAGALSFEIIRSDISGLPIPQHEHSSLPRLRIDSIENIDVKSGASVACDWVTIEVTGEILFRDSSHKKQPLTNATFWQLRNNQSDTQLDANVQPDGAYRVTVTVIDHYFGTTTRTGRHKENYDPGSALLAVRAAGCEPNVFEVSAKKNHKKIVLECSDR